MNYQKIYNDLISNRRTKILTEGYFERHHIIPRYMGGEGNPMFSSHPSEETRQKMRESHLGKPLGPHQIVTCPYCSKSGGVSVMKRWHFDNCKNALQQD